MKMARALTFITAAACAVALNTQAEGIKGGTAPAVGERRQNFQGGRSVTADPGAKVRERNQERHSEQGVRPAQLNRAETRERLQQQQGVRKEERQFNAEGNMPRNWGTRSPGVDARQENQERRIEQGVRSGQLTAEENQTLQNQQDSIQQKEYQFKLDGNLTPQERWQLHRDLNEASRDIYREKHDAETVPGVRPAMPRAGWNPRVIDQREVEQWHRIFTGLRNGQLNWREGARLVAKEEMIARLERRLREDGTLTAEERLRLQRILSELSKEIWREKHDVQQRP